MSSTIDQVAARAGVSMKTVSRVLNNEPHVRPELRERVRQAVEELGYHPSQAARRLAGRKSFLVAFLFNNPNPGYIAAVQSGAALRCREIGYHLVIEPFELAGQARFEVLERLVTALHPDGLFLTPPLSDDVDLLAEIQRRGVKCVRIAGGGPGPGINLATREAEGARSAVKHLISLGHRRIAMVAAPASHRAAAERYEGYRQALEAAGIAVDPSLVVPGAFDAESGEAAAAALLDRPERPTAIFAASDEMALGVMRTAVRLGVAIPRDLSLVGFDDTPASRSVHPALTTVRQPLEQMGAAAVDALVGASDEARLDWRFDLVVRDSTAPLP
ncbi:LacI family DNA-binding transcriptional regulator [Phenylobacterium sp. J367]|uniref:LacI family DNA-binding transcriptional regulator n=1 Tax=Phenylobacterium sp. J367 TaxID=2898435 RepID=UPI002150A0B2|nr:LacI family DNA-binding transcriptional regulator [Phenylobacterium sp. J367]MCR5880825.1 LacI family DNA-binding transcriptional regulator [Phenylobacterium sp. J367]